MKELQWIQELKKDFESGEQALFPPTWEFKDLDDYPIGEIQRQVRLSTEAAKNGNLDEMWAIADYYAFGCKKLNSPRNFKKAIYWYGRVAEQRSEYRGEAIWRVAHCYLHSRGKNKDGKKAFEMLKALAAIDISTIELSKEAAEFISKAAISLAHCYDKGIGTEKDCKRAFEIWREYAEKSESTACYNLGVAYLTDTYCERDYKKALYWTQKAAEYGDVKAINNLGWCYEKGYGTERDIKKAIECYRRAARQGSETAKKNLQRLKKKGIIIEDET